VDGASQRGSWTFLFPVGELYLTEAVGREFRVDRVTFVHRDKLPRVRKRLGLGATVSEVKKILRGWDFFESAEAFAVVRQSGDQEEVERRCLEMVREELSILSLSRLGYARRKNMGPIVGPGEVPNSYAAFLAVSSRDGPWFGNRCRRTAPLAQAVLDGRWKNFQGRMFFTKLLKILRGETKVEGSWRRELRRASVMLGESVGANDLLKSFVWNMVALEMLLTKQDGKLLDTLPRRVEALLGWVFHWEAENYEGRIREMYGKRNELLHHGKRDNITEQDLAFTDHLLVNLLVNLVGNPKLFGSKDDVVEFSERLEAERILELRPRVRPKNLRYIRSVRPEF
jgi:hypothetical protein